MAPLIKSVRIRQVDLQTLLQRRTEAYQSARQAASRCTAQRRLRRAPSPTLAPHQGRVWKDGKAERDEHNRVHALTNYSRPIVPRPAMATAGVSLQIGE